MKMLAAILDDGLVGLAFGQIELLSRKRDLTLSQAERFICRFLPEVGEYQRRSDRRYANKSRSISDVFEPLLPGD